MILRDILSSEETDLTQDIKVGDIIKCHATGHLREVKVTKVTPTYVWIEYISPSTGMYHNSKFRRERAKFEEKTSSRERAKN
jgi:hypothetical protein